MYQKISYGKVDINDGELLRRRTENKDYMLRLQNKHLLLNRALEAGESSLGFFSFDPEGTHGGWESPLCQLRGHFLGHWLSAAAMHYAATGNAEIKARADEIVETLAFYQETNGGKWVASIPEKYLDWIAKGKSLWAPHYTIHKTFMGLVDMYNFADSKKALKVAINFAKWFHEWTAQFSRDQMDDILDVETGGMLEVWADLYCITKEKFLEDLLDRYYRGRLFEPMLAGQDVLTNMHMNTTIPEVLGAARAYEVTGDEKWMDIVKAYWEMGVTNRGMYATGGQTNGEIWSPPHKLSARMGDKAQEHCTVYNMMRLADFLFRHTGEAKYADYWEQNLYNGIMAQAYWRGRYSHGFNSPYPTTALLTYFLPMKGGGQKGWASEKNDFFCCHGTLVQANAAFTEGIYYQNDSGVAVCQYLASKANFEQNGTELSLETVIDPLSGGMNRSSVQDKLQSISDVTAKYPHNPLILAVDLYVECETESEFTLRLRLPWWAKSYTLTVDGQALNTSANEKGFLEIKKAWKRNVIRLELQKELTSFPLPDDPNCVAFMEGPVVLAGICDEERILYGNKDDPTTMLTADNEREWGMWMHTYRTKNQDRGIRFVPLYTIGYERYSVYFPVKKA